MKEHPHKSAASHKYGNAADIEVSSWTQSLRRVITLTALAMLVVSCSSDDASTPNNDNPLTQAQSDDALRKCDEATSELDVSRPPGWQASTHCKSVSAKYEAVFPSNEIPRVLIKMTQDDYQAMQVDLDELVATNGLAPDGDVLGVGTCEGLSQHDSCQIDGEGDNQGQCLLFGTLELVCIPDHATDTAATSGYSPDFTIPSDPCAGGLEGNNCSVNNAAGMCTSDGGPLICEIATFDEADVSDVDLDSAVPFFDRKPKYFKADIEFNGVPFTSVGIRYKGNNSLLSSYTEKKPLRIKLDEWEDDVPAITDQRLHGFQALSFAPNKTDPSYLRQVLTAAEFRRRGVLAPMSGYVEISLDTGDGAKLLGLYAMTEIPDKPMLERLFSNHDGNLYKPDGQGAHFLSFIEKSMHKKNNEESDYADVQSFIDALQADKNNRVVWRSDLTKTFNILGYTEFLAINQAISNWDTYGAIAHNFYLYADETDGQLSFLPWDFDLSFGSLSSTDISLRSLDGTWPLIQAIARDATLSTHYYEILEEYARDRYDSGELNEEIDNLVGLITPAVQREADATENQRLFTGFVDAVASLKEGNDKRRDDIAEFLDNLRNQSSQQQQP